VEFGKVIKNARMSKGIKGKYVAGKLGISLSAYYRIESCETNITIDRADEISNILGMKLIDLLQYKVSDTLNKRKSKGA